MNSKFLVTSQLDCVRDTQYFLEGIRKKKIKKIKEKRTKKKNAVGKIQIGPERSTPSPAWPVVTSPFSPKKGSQMPRWCKTK